MIFKTMLALGAFLLPVSSFASPQADAWEDILQARLSPMGADGVIRFDYKGFAASDTERAALDAYIAELAAMPEPEDDADAAAYWANLYNAVTIDVVADKYPVDSIRDIKPGLFATGPWKKKRVTVAGEKLSLDDIEHAILRERYTNPHIHYMVNCASVGCPNLQPKLWRGDTLEEDRQAAAREFVNSDRGVSLDGDTLTVSSIYEWFQVDFGDSEAGVLDHIREFADAELKAELQGRTGYDADAYDWDINE